MASDMKRYQVFVSSTYLDLKEERQVVISTLLELDAFPSGMELFPATDEDAWTLIKRVIDDCDYYLLVIGGKYGSIDPVDEVSYTEKEYDYAVSQGKPVMAFLHGNVDSIPVGKTERTEAAQQKLVQFRGKIKRAKHVKYWTSAETLGGHVATTFVKFTRLYPAVGWIRADRQTSAESLTEINNLRKRIADLESQLSVVSSEPPPGTENLAQADDKFELRVWITAEYKTLGSTKKVGLWLNIQVTWNDLLRGLGNRLLDECEEQQLHEVLNAWLLSEYLEDQGIYRAIVEKVKDREGADYDTSGIRNAEVEVQDDEFGTVIVQFVALGLIQHNQRKRSVTDKGTYWSLTPFGRTKAIQLRAVPRPSDVRSTEEPSSLG